MSSEEKENTRPTCSSCSLSPPPSPSIIPKSGMTSTPRKSDDATKMEDEAKREREERESKETMLATAVVKAVRRTKTARPKEMIKNVALRLFAMAAESEFEQAEEPEIVGEVQRDHSEGGEVNSQRIERALALYEQISEQNRLKRARESGEGSNARSTEKKTKKSRDQTLSNEVRTTTSFVTGERPIGQIIVDDEVPGPSGLQASTNRRVPSHRFYDEYGWDDDDEMADSIMTMDDDTLMSVMDEYHQSQEASQDAVTVVDEPSQPNTSQKGLHTSLDLVEEVENSPNGGEQYSDTIMDTSTDLAEKETQSGDANVPGANLVQDPISSSQMSKEQGLDASNLAEVELTKEDLPDESLLDAANSTMSVTNQKDKELAQNLVGLLREASGCQSQEMESYDLLEHYRIVNSAPVTDAEEDLCHNSLCTNKCITFKLRLHEVEGDQGDIKLCSRCFWSLRYSAGEPLCALIRLLYRGAISGISLTYLRKMPNGRGVFRLHKDWVEKYFTPGNLTQLTYHLPLKKVSKTVNKSALEISFPIANLEGEHRMVMENTYQVYFKSKFIQETESGATELEFEIVQMAAKSGVQRAASEPYQPSIVDYFKQGKQKYV